MACIRLNPRSETGCGEKTRYLATPTVFRRLPSRPGEEAAFFCALSASMPLDDLDEGTFSVNERWSVRSGGVRCDVRNDARDARDARLERDDSGSAEPNLEPSRQRMSRCETPVRKAVCGCSHCATPAGAL